MSSGKSKKRRKNERTLPQPRRCTTGGPDGLVCRVKTTTYRKATRETTVDVRYFISSLPVDPKRALKAIRGYWGVESMHWTLDMVFDEDHSRARTGHAAENLAILRHLVINLLRLDKTLGGGITKKRKELMWNDETLFRFVKAA